MRSWTELSRSGKLLTNSSVFNWRLKDASEDNVVRDVGKLFHVRAAATEKARSPAVERRVGGTGTTNVDVDDFMSHKMFSSNSCLILLIIKCVCKNLELRISVVSNLLSSRLFPEEWKMSLSFTIVSFQHDQRTRYLPMQLDIIR